uniref:Uncharacterized protein n=1 Tax=Globisporangium ultimum (strain ATCC 200006 / CBS 805.95 / DAOM BR144) TaxID=431595 RepID=K3W8Q0_GLOUD
MAINKTFVNKTQPLRMHADHADAATKKRKDRARSLLYLSHHGVAVDAYARSTAATNQLHGSIVKKKKQAKKPSTRLLHNGLSREAAELKQHIKDTCPATAFKFSFSCMRRLVIPPVAIPRNLACVRAKTTVVSGKHIPMTKAMWEKQKQQLTQRLPDCIDERISY